MPAQLLTLDEFCSDLPKWYGARHREIPAEGEPTLEQIAEYAMIGDAEIIPALEQRLGPLDAVGSISNARGHNRWRCAERDGC